MTATETRTPVDRILVCGGRDYADKETIKRTRFERIIERAMLKPWERLFQNLRASRETELAAEYPEGFEYVEYY